jgi:hypothetical protein
VPPQRGEAQRAGFWSSRPRKRSHSGSRAPSRALTFEPGASSCPPSSAVVLHRGVAASRTLNRAVAGQTSHAISALGRERDRRSVPTVGRQAASATTPNGIRTRDFLREKQRLTSQTLLRKSIYAPSSSGPALEPASSRSRDRREESVSVNLMVNSMMAPRSATSIWPR